MPGRGGTRLAVSQGAPVAGIQVRPRGARGRAVRQPATGAVVPQGTGPARSCGVVVGVVLPGGTVAAVAFCGRRGVRAGGARHGCRAVSSSAVKARGTDSACRGTTIGRVEATGATDTL